MNIPDMATASFQDIYNYVAQAIIKQGKPAMMNSAICAYRAPDGCKCAIGHLIPDDMYHSGLENKRAWTVVGPMIAPAVVIKLPGVTPDETLNERLTFFNLLQNAHDEADRTNFLHDFRNRMIRVARRFHLTP